VWHPADSDEVHDIMQRHGRSRSRAGRPVKLPRTIVDYRFTQLVVVIGLPVRARVTPRFRARTGVMGRAGVTEQLITSSNHGATDPTSDPFSR
jgi:hypothetical protein